MWIRMLTVAAGPHGCFPSGAIREVSDAEGKALIDGVFAEQCDKPGKAPRAVEAAVMVAPERAMPNPPSRKVASHARGDEA